MDNKELIDIIQENYDKYDEKYKQANKQWNDLRDKPVKTIPEQIVLDTARINTSYLLGAKTALANLMHEITIVNTLPKKNK